VFKIYWGIYITVLIGNFVGFGKGDILGVSVKGGNISGRGTLNGKFLVGTNILKCKKFLD
jgi:hypothetical protein